MSETKQPVGLLGVGKTIGQSTEIVDLSRDGGEGEPLIVARFYDEAAQRLFLAAPEMFDALTGLSLVPGLADCIGPDRMQMLLDLICNARFGTEGRPC